MQDLDQTANNKTAVQAKWLRGLYMLVFIACGWVAVGLAVIVTIFQFLLVLFTDNSNENLSKFGKSLSSYFYQLVQYLTYNTEEKPFPFSAWPPAAVDVKTTKEYKTHS